MQILCVTTATPLQNIFLKNQIKENYDNIAVT